MAAASQPAAAAATGQELYDERLQRARQVPPERRGGEIAAFLEWHDQLEEAAAELGVVYLGAPSAHCARCRVLPPPIHTRTSPTPQHIMSAAGASAERQVAGALRYLWVAFASIPASSALHPRFRPPYALLLPAMAPLVHARVVTPPHGVAIDVQPAMKAVMQAAMESMRPPPTSSACCSTPSCASTHSSTARRT